MIIPIRKMNERISIEKLDSDTSYLFQLLYAGEQLLKLVTCALVTSIDDNEATLKYNKYALNYTLVHADSLGYWYGVLSSIASGEANQFIRKDFEPIIDELLVRSSIDSWQNRAVSLIHQCLKSLKEDFGQLPSKPNLLKWFSLFCELRNEARAHGIPSADSKSKICSRLDESLKLISENLLLFKTPWFFAKKNASGNFRITPLNDIVDNSVIQRKLDSNIHDDGVYLFVGDAFRMDVIYSTAEALDFYLPNGNFKSKTYETLSYLTGNKVHRSTADYDSTPWLTEEPFYKKVMKETRDDRFEAAENIVDRYDDWLVGALNFDEDLHFSSFYLDQSWQNKLPKQFKPYGYECMIACYHNFEEIYYIPEGECYKVANNLIQKINDDPNWFVNILDTIVNLSDELLKVFPFNPESIPFYNMQNDELLEYYTKQ